MKVAKKDIEPLGEELNSIFEWIEKLEEVDTEGVAPLTSIFKRDMQKREDKVLEEESREEILSNSPQKNDMFFVVPKVVE